MSPEPPACDRISRFAPQALYWQVAEILRERITAGSYPPGRPLPSVPDLRAEFDVSRDVLQRAIALLRAEGIVDHRPGGRNLVRARPTRQPVHLPPGVCAIARMPTPGERTSLDLPDGVPILAIGDEIYPGDRYELHAEQTPPRQRGKK